MGILKRAINIIRSNINSNNTSDGGIADVDLDSFFQQEQCFRQTYADNAGEVLSSEEKMEQEYYGNLELPKGASFEEIKKQYRFLLKKYHPDKFNNDEKKRQLAEQVVAKLNTAYSYFENKYKT